MVESTLTGFPVPPAYPHPDPGRSGVASTQPWCQLFAPREPSTLPEIFVRSLISNESHVPDGDEVDLNIVLDLRLYVEVVPGKEQGCFILPDTYTLVLVIWSPLPVPCRPMVIAQLDQFMGIGRDIPIAPLWAADVQGSKENPLRFLRPAHWVHKRVEDALSRSKFTTTLSPGTLNIWTSIISEINTLILFFERSRLSRHLQANPPPRPPPRPRPVHRRQRSSVDINAVSEGVGSLQLQQGVEGVPEDSVDKSGVGTSEL